MITQNHNGNLDGVRVSFTSASLSSIDGPSKTNRTSMLTTDLSMSEILSQITGAQIINQITDMATLIEVYNEAEKIILDAKAA